MKPEYVYQPGRLLSRLIKSSDRNSATAVSSFGFPLDIMPDELISNSIRRKGMYDIVTAEAIYRLLDPGAHAIDAGAHVGLMSAVMALRVGAAGRILSFEPHPVVYAFLERNAARLNSALRSEVIRAHNVAVSDVSGQSSLYLPEDWQRNTGVARLAASTNSTPIFVSCVPLDEVEMELPELMKMDVEGHELAVLRGAGKTLAKLRDVVFEDFAPYPSPVMTLFEQNGFRVFALSRTLSRPVLSSPDRRGVPKNADPNFLATRDPDRAHARFKASGWNVLRKLFQKT